MQDLRLVLRDIDPEVVLALTEQCAPLDRVSVGVGDLLCAGVDAVVVPIQDFSFLDQGFVAACRAAFRVQAWSHLKVIVERRFGGTIPVGDAVLVSTGLRGVRWMVAAPARHGERFEGVHVYKTDHGCMELADATRLGAQRPELRAAGGMTQATSARRSSVSPAEGAGLALAAALRVVAAADEPIRTLGCPGLGTGAAGGDPWACAREMRRAWLDHQTR